MSDCILLCAEIQNSVLINKFIFAILWKLLYTQQISFDSLTENSELKRDCLEISNQIEAACNDMNPSEYNQSKKTNRKPEENCDTIDVVQSLTKIHQLVQELLYE